MKYVACLLTVCAAAPAVFGCATTEARDAAEAEKIRADIEGRAVMVNEGNGAGLLAAWDENGTLLAPNMPPISGEGLTKINKKIFETWDFSNRVHDVKDVVVSGDWAFAWCLYSEERTPKAGGETVTFHGKALAVLKKQPDGSWKKYVDCSNTSPPPE